MATTNLSTSRDADFEQQHRDDLSAKRFAVTRGTQFLVPLAAAAVGAGIGWFALHTPLRKLFPHKTALAGLAADFTVASKTSILGAVKKVGAAFPHLIERAKQTNPNFSLQGWGGLKELAGLATADEINRIRETLGGDPKAEIKAVRWVGAGVLAFVGDLFGSIFVGYDQWRKDESARLAAGEVNRDISKLELFKPSDPELVAENKRLRAMLAETDTPATRDTKPQHTKPELDLDSVSHEGRIHNREKELA